MSPATVYFHMRFAYQKVIYGIDWLGGSVLIATILAFTRALQILRKKIDEQESEMKHLRSSLPKRDQ